MLNRMRSDEGGFTLIELLVVILIIGILAAIALPSFLGQQKKGQDSSAKSNARNLVSQVESCFTESETYAAPCNAPTGSGLDLDAAGALPAEGKVSVTASNASSYSIVALSKSGQYFAINKTGTGTTRSCGAAMTTAGVGSGAAEGGCKTGNTW